MFQIDFNALEANMLAKGRVEHRTGNRILLFPFPANDKKLKELQEDLYAFKGIAGVFFRECLQYSQPLNFTKEKFLESACQQAQAPGNAYLKDILEKLAFDENDQLIVFNARIFRHLDHYVKNKTLSDIARYLVSLFIDDEERHHLMALAQKEPDNLMHRLILACLPKPEKTESQLESYYKASPKIRQKFKEDLITLTQDPAFFASGFQKLLKFYFFLYVTELVFQLEAFFDEKKDRLFFSLSWEKLQASRLPSINGWELFEKHLNGIFSHANTLELLNYITGMESGPVTYQEFANVVNGLNGPAKADLQLRLEELIDFYTLGIKDVNWGEFTCKNKYPQEPVFNLVYRLWQLVDYQFHKTKRKRPYGAYNKWFGDFTKLNYARRRGRNGYSLSLDQESILFLTRLCIGPQDDKIRLSKLWQELEDRGFFFDQLSKVGIVEYFEKINLLEKKSDSGDAQYVRKLR